MSIKTMNISQSLVLTVLGIALSSSPLATTKAAPLDVWHARNSGVTNAFNADAYGNGTFVVVGNQGTIVTSADAVAWASQNSGTANDLNSIVFANGLFVAVGQFGTIVTSTNGTLWTTRNSGTTDFLYDVNFGNGLFVAISDTGTEVTSADEISWTSQGSGTQGLYGLIYGNGKFVAVGGLLNCSFFFCFYNSVSYTSSDGLTWAPSNPGPAYLLSDIAFGNGMFVAVGDGGTIVTSADGTSWATPPSGASELLLNVAYGHGTFVVVGAQQGGIYTSTDAAHWAARNSGTTNGLFNITYGNGTFLAVGNSGTILQSDPVAAPPILAISSSANQVQFSWPLAGTFSLQETGDLTAPSWSPPANQVSTMMLGQMVVTVPIPPGNRFYRLVGTL
jgi:hypothetical protein